MDTAAYHSLRNLQDSHWWFVGRRTIIRDLINRFVNPPSDARILEAGCGYGGNLRMLGQFGTLDAFEFDAEARVYASRLLSREVAYGFLPERVGFEGEGFDLIAMLDVLEHIEDDHNSLVALKERLKSRGSILLTVPALPWLWSRHDEIHHHKRRYTKAGLERLLNDAGFEVTSIGYFNTILFPLALIQRLGWRLTGGQSNADEMPPRFLNTILTGILSLEKWLIGRIGFPIGLSVYAVASVRDN